MVNLDSHDEQSLLVISRKHCSSIGEVYKRISGEVSYAKFRRHWMGKPCYALVSFPGWGTVWNHMTIWTSTFPHVPYGFFLQEICSKRNSGLQRTTGYCKYANRCFALVSTCCHVSLYLHTYLVHYVTAVCMIACLSIVRSKLSDLYEWLH